MPFPDSWADSFQQLLPRAHRQGLATNHTGGNAGFLVIEDTDLPPTSFNPIVAAGSLGGAVFMTNLTPHCSTPNYSDDIRWSIDLRYQGADVPNNVGLWPTAETAGEASEMLEPFQMACYPPEADFVVQSRRHPAETMTYESFVNRRATFEQVKSIAYPKREWTPVLLHAD